MLAALVPLAIFERNSSVLNKRREIRNVKTVGGHGGPTIEQVEKVDWLSAYSYARFRNEKRETVFLFRGQLPIANCGFQRETRNGPAGGGRGTGNGR